MPFALLLLAVSRAHPPTLEGLAQTSTGVTMERVLSEAYSGIEDRRRLVIRDADSWRGLWAEAMRNRSPSPAAPVIDFDHEMVVVASMGRRGTGGYAIDISGIAQTGDTLTVIVLETSPGANCFLTQALTGPVVAVKIPRSAATVSFDERTETQDCN